MHLQYLYIAMNYYKSLFFRLPIPVAFLFVMLAVPFLSLLREGSALWVMTPAYLVLWGSPVLLLGVGWISLDLLLLGHYLVWRVGEKG